MPLIAVALVYLVIVGDLHKLESDSGKSVRVSVMGERPLIQGWNPRRAGKIDVLKDITVDIYKGDVVFVVGPSGSGKSTFLHSQKHLEEPTKRHIYFEA